MKYMNPYTIHRNNKQYLTQLNKSSENLFHRNFNDKKLLKHNYDGYLTNESLQIHGLSKESFKPLKADLSIDHLKQYQNSKIIKQIGNTRLLTKTPTIFEDNSNSLNV